MENRSFYNEILTEHNVRPEFKHDLPDADIVLEGVNPSCGDDIFLKLKTDGDTITDGAFVGDGCAISQASADIMLGMIVGKKKEEALQMGKIFMKMIKGDASEEEIDSLEEASALRDIAHMPARVKCAVLGWRTLKEALLGEDADDDDDEDDEDDEDRYDWDLEDDGRKMIIIGAVFAVILCVVIGLGAMWFMGRNKSDSDSAASSQTEEQQEDAAADLVIKGDGDTADDAEPAEETDAEETEETEEAAPEEEEAEPEEPQTVTMKVNASSLNVRSEANTTSSVVTSLTNGDTVEVLGDASQEWVQIRCTSKNNEEGYVKSEYLVAAE